MSYKKIKNMTAAILLGCPLTVLYVVVGYYSGGTGERQENIFYSSGI